MALDNEQEPKRWNHEAEVDADARAAYDEVMGRGKGSADTSTETVTEGRGGAGAASRPPATEKAPAPEEKPRDDGRDTKGRFASTKSEPTPDKTSAPEKAPQQVTDDKAKPADGAQPVAGGPPPSFSVKTKAEWQQLPEHVRADIIKRETEMGQGLKALQDYKDLRPYQELAQRHNTTIPKALDHFVRMENLIRQNPGAGMAAIAQNMGMNQQQAARLFADLAMKFGGQQASGQGGIQGGVGTQGAGGQPVDPLTEALRPALSQMLGPLMQKFDQMQGAWTAREQADRNAQEQSLVSAIDAFAANPDNRFYPELEPTMTKIMESGMVPVTGNHAADLKTAYDMAARMHPEVSEALIEQRLKAGQEAQRKAEQEAVSNARNASRSLTGSRMPGSAVVNTEGQRKPGASYEEDLEADVLNAFRRHQRN